LTIPIEGSLNSGDVLLLHFAYSLEVTVSASLIKLMMRQYSSGIVSLPLRHSIIAYATTQRPHDEYLSRQTAIHYAKARKALRTKVQGRQLITDTDVLTAMMLAWTAYAQNSTKSAVGHADGCLALLKGLLKTRRTSPFLDVFIPLILDDMRTILLMRRDPSPVAADPAKVTTFDERYGYYRELCWAGTPPQAWQECSLEATYNFLRGAVGQSLNFLKKVALLARDGLDTRAQYDTMTGYLRSKLDDKGFQRTLADLERTIREQHIQHVSSGDHVFQLTAYQCMGRDVLKLLLSVIDPANDNILAGFTSLNSRLISMQICTTAWQYGAPVKELKYFCDVYYSYVSTAALVYSATEQQSCNPFLFALTSTGTWIIEHLQTGGLPQTANHLSSWWISKTHAALIDFAESFEKETWALGVKWH
jgi:hypothetical protein